MVHGNVASPPHARLIAKTWSWEIHLALDSPISSWMKEKRIPGGFYQTDPAIPWRCRLLFCSAGGLGILQRGHLFLLPADPPLPRDGSGWPRSCRRAPARSCPVAGRDGRWLRCPAAFHTHAGFTWQNKLLLITCPYGRGRGGGGTPSRRSCRLSQLCFQKNNAVKARGNLLWRGLVAANPKMCCTLRGRGERRFAAPCSCS